MRGGLRALTASLVVLGILATINQARPGPVRIFEQTATQTTTQTATARAKVDSGQHDVLFGVSLDGGAAALDQYSHRLGRTPAVVVSFTRFPMTDAETQWLDQSIEDLSSRGVDLVLTLEPYEGLDTVTHSAARDLATRLAGYNAEGVKVYVRFAHEMNGSWFPWGQQPTAYVEAFRRVAAAVHELAPASAMMWAPNYGGGYPFPTGEYHAEPGSPQAQAADTDGDGALTPADDPYRPYWPGRDHVDWVGMSVYHWGTAYPWGENEIPERGKFKDHLLGTYNGDGGDERAVPNFYHRYGERLRIPVAVTETAAMYAVDRGGSPELDVKSAWWRQVFSRSTRDLGWLRMINWFEWYKYESEIGSDVDWTVTLDPGPVRREFVDELPVWLTYAP